MSQSLKESDLVPTLEVIKDSIMAIQDLCAILSNDGISGFKSRSKEINQNLANIENEATSLIRDYSD